MAAGGGHRGRLHRRGEHVAAGAHRLDHGGVLRIGFDLAPDAADQHVDAALERAGVAALGEIEQAVARQHAARPFAEGAQQVELGAGHRHPRAGRIAQLAQAKIDPPAQKGEGGRAIGGADGLGGGLAAQHRVDPRQQFARIERLGQVIVGAHFQPENAVDVLAARGQHDDRHLRFRADLAAQAEAVVAGQHHVEDQKVDAVLGHRPAISRPSVAVVTLQPLVRRYFAINARVSRSSSTTRMFGDAVAMRDLCLDSGSRRRIFVSQYF